LGAITLVIIARKLRIEYPGAIYHVMSRGDRREDILADDKDHKASKCSFRGGCGGRPR